MFLLSWALPRAPAKGQGAHLEHLELARMEELGGGGCSLLHLHVRQAVSIRPFVDFGKNLLELQNLFFFLQISALALAAF